ncbi:MAG: hypothetical protein AAB447_00715 [Patescibacteria group bacterium]
MSLYKIIGILAVVSTFVYAMFLGTSFSDKRSAPADYKDATYVIDGKPVTLAHGVAESPVAPDSVSKIITRYFGNEVTHDFDGDGREDVAFLITQETGGSGVFYYLVAAVNTKDGYVGSHGVFLGDRIAPQTTEMGKGNIVLVNYADRKPGESFATRPSVGKSIWLLLDTKTGQFGQVEQNFEGEMDRTRLGSFMNQYLSSEFGIEFFYPKNYFLETKEFGNAERRHVAIILTEDTKENKAVREGRAPGREGPVAITFDLYQNPEGGTPLQWVKGNNNSNYKLSSTGTIRNTIVASESAVAYSFSGLYEADATAFAHRGYMVLATVTYLTPEDQIRKDFTALLKTVLLQ